MSEVTRGAPGSWQYLGWWKDGQLDLGETRAQLPVSEQTAALLLAMELPDELHHVPGLGRSGTWYIWDGRCHRPDESASAERMIIRYAMRAEALLGQCRQLVYAAEAARLGPEATTADIEAAVRVAWKAWDPQVKYHAGLQKTANSRSLLAKLAEVVGVSEDAMEDRWPEYLNCANGVVCLRTGRVYKHNPQWMMTYCLGTAYVPGARGAGWEQLSWHVSGCNPEVAQYLMRMLGYSLLGRNPDALIFFLNGPTGSGKSVLLGVVADVLGVLAHDSSAALITSSRTGERNARVENSIAGKRMVTITETSERMRIDEGQLKRLSDSGRVSVNRHYAPKEIPTWITWAIWASTNEMPTMPSFDDAVRRRFRCIPAGATIPEHLRDKGLRARIVDGEDEAVLACLVAGCVDYFAMGEQRPAEVELATANYQSEQDTVAAFREERTRMIPLAEMNGRVPCVNLSEVYPAYIDWCHDTRTPSIGKHTFNDRFKSLPGIQYDEHHKRFRFLELLPSRSGSREDA